MLAGFCETLRRGCEPVWSGLLTHPFLRELASGTLPPDKFRFFLEQDLLFLPEYCRALAIGLAKAEDEPARRQLARALSDTLELELPGTRALLERAIDIGAEDRGGAAAPAPASLAYASFLVATAFRGGTLETLTAVMPCAWSYADVAVALRDEIAEHPLYADWLRFYASTDYGALVAELKAELERLAAAADAPRVRRCAEIFTTGARLEQSFWDMAYRLDQWPDLAG